MVGLVDPELPEAGKEDSPGAIFSRQVSQEERGSLPQGVDSRGGGEGQLGMHKAEEIKITALSGLKSGA